MSTRRYNRRYSQSLNGEWCFKLDPKDEGIRQKWFYRNNFGWRKITVPGSWQVQGFGYKGKSMPGWDIIQPAPGMEVLKDNVQKLKAEYVGTGWYKKNFVVPDDLADKKIWLNIGNVYPSCEVWMNGKLAGSHTAPLIPYRVDITSHIVRGGNNELAIRVYEKNRFLGGFAFNCLANWSGLYGNVELETTSELMIADIFAKPNLINSCADIDVSIKNDTRHQSNLNIICVASAQGKQVSVVSKNISVKPNISSFKINLPINSPRLWSPEEPNLYELKVVLKDSDNKIIDELDNRFGMREFRVSGRKLYLNGERIFLRGHGDDAVFPDTGCPSADKKYYLHALRTSKSYGFNFVSPYYFPPSDFFEAADEVGMLVQEGVFLVGGEIKDDSGRIFYHRDFNLTHPMYLLVKKNWEKIILQNKNHPSLMSYMISAEQWSYSPSMVECYNDLYKTAKQLDPTRLVISNDGSDSHGMDVEKTDLISKHTHPVFLKMPMPAGTEKERIGFTKQLKDARKKPYLLHEYGYTSSYPNLKLRKDYNKGVLPCWLDTAEKVAREKGDFHLLPVFTANSEKLQRIIRKLAIEEARKMPELAGFIWWLFQDTFGAVEGIVDDFYRPKNVKPKEFLQSNGETVLLINRDRRMFAWGDTLRAEILVSHHSSRKIEGAKLVWNLTDGKGMKIKGVEAVSVNGYANGAKIADINIKLPYNAKPAKMVFNARFEKDGKLINFNSWDSWAFPNSKERFSRNVYVAYGQHIFRNWLEVKSRFPGLKSIFATDLTGFKNFPDFSLIVADGLGSEEAINFLVNGGNMIVFVKKGTLPDLVAFYRTMFWNDPADIWGTLGTIVNDHPSLGDFPQEGWCDLQFRSLFEDTNALNLDEFPVKIEPIIRIIDNYRLCRKRAHLIEFKVGKGKVLATSFNFRDTLGVLPEANYLFSQFVKYCLSDKFRPKAEIKPQLLKKMIRTVPAIHE